MRGVFLQTVVGCIVWMLTTFFVTFFMVSQTNKRIALLQENTDETKSKTEEISKVTKSYEINMVHILIAVLFFGVSAICGYSAFKNAVSIIAFIELCVCFHACMGAAIIDIKLRIIPNYIPLTLIIIRFIIFIYELFVQEDAVKGFLSSIVGCFLCGLVLVIADRLSKGGVGAGDTKLIAAIGFISGAYTVITVMTLALIVCAIVALVLLLTKKKTVKGDVPFGPFVFIGFALMILIYAFN